MRPIDLMNMSEERHKKQAISVLIVDDHPLFRDGLRKALDTADDVRVVGQCVNGKEALRAVRALRPAVALLDVNLPDINGLQVARQIKSGFPDTAVIVLTAYHDTVQILHAMRSGASAYCAKDVTPAELLRVIRQAAAGRYMVDNQQMTASQLQTWINGHIEARNSPQIVDPEEHFHPLSPREMQILQCVTQGLSNKEIATELQISQQTVKNHMTAVLKKLNVEDRTQAAVTALRHGWVRIETFDLKQ